MVIKWRSRGESQRVKAEILQAYFAVPQPSQRAIAQRLHVSQPYVAKLVRKIGSSPKTVISVPPVAGDGRSSDKSRR